MQTELTKEGKDNLVPARELIVAESDDARTSSTVTAADLLVIALILAFGILAFMFHRRAADFVGEDVFYADCARSLIERGFYGIDGRPETTQPPGLPAIFALLFLKFGYSYPICLRTMAVFSTLGFLATYWLLRRRLAKVMVGAICILLISSPLYFRTTTQEVWPCFPFFFATTIALLLAEEYENAPTLGLRITWGVLLSATIAASQMLASAGIALLGAIGAVVCATFLSDRRVAVIRLRRFLPIILVGVAVQGMWMLRKPAPREWTLPGYPAPYFEQLKVKNGNYPELGMATVRDIPLRIWENVEDQIDVLVTVTLRHGVNTSKVFIVMVPVLLVALGWTYSLWQTGGGQLLEWYFVAYEIIYLLWPWKGARFFLPVAPFACFYAWQGMKAIHLLAIRKPRALGIVAFPVWSLLGIFGMHWIHRHWEHGLGRFPDELMAPLWFLLGFGAACMAYTGRPLPLLLSNSRIGQWFARPLEFLRISPLRLVQYGVACIAIALIAIGLVLQVGIARDNMNFTDLLRTRGTDVNSMAFEVEGASWIRYHTPSNSVVMARHVPIVYHYSQRRLVWFAPVSNPAVLMEGITMHKVNYVVVVKHKNPYYLPDDDYCFDRLLAIRGDAFKMVFQDSNLRVFEVNQT